MQLYYPHDRGPTLGHVIADLTEYGTKEHSVHVYIYGACAARLHFAIQEGGGLPPGAADVAKGATEFIMNRAIDEHGTWEVLDLNLDRQGCWHDDFDVDAVLIERAPGSPVQLYLPAPEQLAINRILSGVEAEVQEILALMQLPGASWDRLEQITKDMVNWSESPDKEDLFRDLDYVMRRRSQRP